MSKNPVKVFRSSSLSSPSEGVEVAIYRTAEVEAESEVPYDSQLSAFVITTNRVKKVEGKKYENVGEIVACDIPVVVILMNQAFSWLLAQRTP